MQTTVGHVRFMGRPGHLPFSRDLMSFLGWELLDEDDLPPANEPMLGVASAGGTSVWFTGNARDVSDDDDGRA